MGPGITKSRHSEDRARDAYDDLIDVPEPGAPIGPDDERRALSKQAGERLWAARLRAGWSRRQLAIALDCSRQCLANWEEAGDRHRKPPWLDEKLVLVAPDVARHLFGSHAPKLKRAS